MCRLRGIEAANSQNSRQPVKSAANPTTFPRDCRRCHLPTQLSLQYSPQPASSPSHGLPTSITKSHILPYGPLCTELLALVARPSPTSSHRLVLLCAHSSSCRAVQERSQLRFSRLARVARSALIRRTVNCRSQRAVGLPSLAQSRPTDVDARIIDILAAINDPERKYSCSFSRT
jgi:hypothetical protein